MEDLVAIAKIAKTRGLRGEVVAEVLTDFPERFNGLKRVFAVCAAREVSELTLEKHWFQKNRVVLKFAGYDSVERAETLRDCEICIAESQVAALESDEYFDWQLEHCAVETVEGEQIGRVKEIMRTGGTEILVVENGEKEYLIPFAKAICLQVDIENKLIRVDLPEGLLDF